MGQILTSVMTHQLNTQVNSISESCCATNNQFKDLTNVDILDCFARQRIFSKTHDKNPRDTNEITIIRIRSV